MYAIGSQELKPNSVGQVALFDVVDKIVNKFIEVIEEVIGD